MNLVGVFREGEIDGKPFLIFNLSSQKDSLTSSSSGESANIDSGGDDHLCLQPHFLCPRLRLKVQNLKHKLLHPDYDSDGAIPLDTSPHFSNADQQVQFLLDFESYDDSDNYDDSDSHDDICKLPVAPLFWCNNKQSDTRTFFCYGCVSSDLGTNYYLCPTCDKKFHRECVESPLEIKHPSHPFHPFLSLQLYHHRNRIAYHCPTSKLVMEPILAMKPIPIVIDHPKRHPHPLTFFPKQASLPCDVCSLVKKLIMPTYVCVRCVYVVHQECIYSPNVIKISRHSQHRIYLTSSLPSGNWSCGVCRQKVDNHYGAYSCNKCGNYFVHTRCALREDVWDGEDLEGVPEEPAIIVEPFETISDGIILHFSHGHNLKLEICRVYDEDKFCQACILPIYEGSYFSCMDKCDFILHETCANAPRMKHHALHAHPLTLKVVTATYKQTGMRKIIFGWKSCFNYRGFFNCSACHRSSCGFVYEFSGEEFGAFRLDLRCASVSEPFKYQGHEHPLFLALNPEEEDSATCQICQEVGGGDNYCRKLNCIECNYIICFRCATLPYKAMYKHDKHLLTFSKGKEANDHSGWCEICEEKLVYSRKGGFYACDDCCTTLHVDCLLGIDPYMMKPGEIITYWGSSLFTVRNSTMSRPLCQIHPDGHRCPYRVSFKLVDMTCCALPE